MKPSANFALLGAICLASCQKPPTAEQVFQDKVEASVRETLRDPTSATFDNWTLNQEENVACAQVNAKNGYGGYTGKEWFVYDNGLVHHADHKRKSGFSKSFDQCMSISMARSEQKRRDAEAEIEKICRENKGVC